MDAQAESTDGPLLPSPIAAKHYLEIKFAGRRDGAQAGLGWGLSVSSIDSNAPGQEPGGTQGGLLTAAAFRP